MSSGRLGSSKNSALLLVVLISGDGGAQPTSAEPATMSAAEPPVIPERPPEPVRCPTGFHVYSVDPPACEADPAALGPEATFRGTLVLAPEQVEFVPSGPRAGKYWVSISNTELEQCIVDLADSAIRPRTYSVAFQGRVASRPGGRYGHFGLYDREVRIGAFVAGNPCS